MSSNNLLLLISVLSATIAQIFLKKGMLAMGKLEFSASNLLSLIAEIFKSKWLLGGIFMFIISFLSYLFLLSKLKLNFVQPVSVSAGIVFVAVASWIFLGEHLSFRQIMGIVLIILGIFLLFPRR